MLSKKLNIPHKTLYNVCVPMPNGNFREVDAIIITSQDIFVLECKNRSGNFSGHYTSQMWLQHIGSQEHEVPNIYLQNQEHIAAIEYYLKSKGLMHDFGTCHNMLLSNGHMSLELSGSAANFYYGDIDFLKKNIQEICTKASARSGEDAAFIDNVCLALLPQRNFTQGADAGTGIFIDERYFSSYIKKKRHCNFHRSNIYYVLSSKFCIMIGF